MSTTTNTKRTAGTLAAIAAVAGLTCAGAGIASAGTVPVRPGYATSTMTITNHTNSYEFLDSTQPSGQWVNAPKSILGPGQSETVVSTGPGWQSVFVNYRLGLTGGHAIYHLENARGDVNTNMTGTTGGSHRFIGTQIESGYPVVNASYDLW